jgi:putative peptide zinc metalloprotease protein
MRELLFDLGDPPPEAMSPHKQHLLVMFAWGTWIYRLFLFIGIAVLVYHSFAKALGIFLFAVEIGWFILLPVYRESLIWKARWPQLRERPRSRWTLFGVLLFLFLLCLPWPTRLVASGLLQPTEVFAVYAPTAAMVKNLPVPEGENVTIGQVLLELSSPELESRYQGSIARVERLHQQAGSAGFDPEARMQLVSLQEQLATAQAELSGVVAEMAHLAPKAPFAGRLRDVDPDLKAGAWLKNRERVATLVSDTSWRVEAYFDEEAVHRLHVGDAGRFFAEGMSGSALALNISAIDTDATRVMPSGLLTAPAGGTVVIRQQAGQRIPERANYRVTFKVTDPPENLTDHAWRGDVVVRGDWEIPWLSFARSALALLWREWGF